VSLVFIFNMPVNYPSKMTGKSKTLAYLNIIIESLTQQHIKIKIITCLCSVTEYNTAIVVKIVIEKKTTKQQLFIVRIGCLSVSIYLFNSVTFCNKRFKGRSLNFNTEIK
jgi:hypothetical protein